MFKGLRAFLTVDSTFLLGGGGATDIFIVGGGGATDIFIVGGGASSAKDRGEGIFIFVFKVRVDS